jgi:flavodoxin
MSMKHETYGNIGLEAWTWNMKEKQYETWYETWNMKHEDETWAYKLMETYKDMEAAYGSETWNMKHGTGNIVLWNMNMKLWNMKHKHET